MAPPGAAAPLPPAAGLPAAGTISEVSEFDNSPGLSVAGEAAPGTLSVVVLVGPRSADQPLWAAETLVRDGTWQIDIDTPPALSDPYKVKAYYNSHSVPGFANDDYDYATQPKALCLVSIRDAPDCLDVHLGPPSTYESGTPPS